MRDLNRRNWFAWKTATGRYFRIEYSDAWARLQRGLDVYEKVMPDCSTTREDRAAIPWTLIDPDAEEA